MAKNIDNIIIYKFQKKSTNQYYTSLKSYMLFINFKKHSWTGGDQDCRVGGCGTHLPPWTHQKYIYMWKNSHWKLTGDWQKRILYNQGCKKDIHTELGRKGREAIRSGLLLLGGDSEDEGDYMGGDPPWGVSGLSHILGASALGSDTRKMSPLGRLEGWWD